MSIAALAGGETSEHRVQGNRQNRWRSQRQGGAQRRGGAMHSILSGGAHSMSAEERFQRPDKPGCRSRIDVQEKQNHRNSATDIYGGVIDYFDDNKVQNSKAGNSKQDLNNSHNQEAKHSSNRDQRESKHYNIHEQRPVQKLTIRPEEKHDYEEFRRWKQQREQSQKYDDDRRHHDQSEQQQISAANFSGNQEAFQTRHIKSSKIIGNMGLEEDVYDSADIPKLDLHNMQDQSYRRCTQSMSQETRQHTSDNHRQLNRDSTNMSNSPSTTRLDTREIPLHAKVENVRFFIDKEAQNKIKTLPASERLSRRGPKLRRQIRHRVLNELFEDAVIKSQRKNQNGEQLASSRSTTTHGASQIFFGDDNRKSGTIRSRNAQDNAVYTSRLSSNYSGRRRERSIKGRSSSYSSSTAIMENAFILAVQRMTINDLPPFTRTEASQLWRSCKGDYSNFAKIVFSKGSGGSKNKSLSKIEKQRSGSKIAFGKKMHDPALLSLKNAVKVERARPQIMKGPWHRNGKGVRTVKVPPAEKIPRRMQYRFCRTTVQPPSDFVRHDIQRSAQMPKTHLSLQHIYGFRGQDFASHGNALYISSVGEAVYFAAGTGIVMDVPSREQRFLSGHNDDITVMSMNKRRDLVVTGQMGSRSCLYIWSVNTCQLLNKVGFGRTTKPNGVVRRQPYYERWVCAACFTHDSRYVIGVGCNDSHMLAVWHIGFAARDGTLIAESACQNGAPPKVYGAVASGHTSVGLVANGQEYYFLTFGEAHLKFWVLRPSEDSNHLRLSSSSAIYKSFPKPRKILCAAFLPSGHAVTGGSNGMVYMWWNGECVHAFQAYEHGPCSSISVVEPDDLTNLKVPTKSGILPSGAGSNTSNGNLESHVKVPQLLELQRIQQSVSFYTGGADGLVIAWRGSANVNSARDAYSYTESTQFRHTYRDFEVVAKISLCEAVASIQNASYSSDGGHISVAFGGGTAVQAHRSKTFAARDNHLQRRSNSHVSGVQSRNYRRKKNKSRNSKTTVSNTKSRSSVLIQSLDFHGGYVFAATTEDTLFVIGASGGVTHSSFNHSHPRVAKMGSTRSVTPGVKRPSTSIGRAMALSAAMISVNHFGGLYGLAPHPHHKNVFFTLGADRQIVCWHALRREALFRAVLPRGQMVVSCVDVHPKDDHLAVGFDNGAVVVYDLKETLVRCGIANPPVGLTGYGSGGCEGQPGRDWLPGILVMLPEISRWQHSTEGITVLKFAPDGLKLVAGTKDSFIDVYKIQKQSIPGRGRQTESLSQYSFWHRMTGHSATVTCADWSCNSQFLQSNCNTYEIIYWDIKSGRPIASLADSIEKDTNWYTWTCLLGFPVMGIWPDYSDGSDINSLQLTKDKRFVVTADDHGKVKLFNAPCVVEDAPALTYSGHSSHVTGVRFLLHDSHVVSIGGLDEAIFQWKYVHKKFDLTNENSQYTFAVENLKKTRPW